MAVVPASVRLTNPASAAGDSPALVEFYGPLIATGDQHPSGARARGARQLQAVVRPRPAEGMFQTPPASAGTIGC